MDTSKEYIEMCEKATEIREKWEEQDGDFVYFLGDEEEDFPPRSYIFPLAYTWTDWKIEKFIWLPRQDQLQEMIDGDWFENLRGFWHWSNTEIDWKGGIALQAEPCNSMEQLWLAFVMKEKYNKTWDGKEWVKEVQ